MSRTKRPDFVDLTESPPPTRKRRACRPPPQHISLLDEEEKIPASPGRDPLLFLSPRLAEEIRLEFSEPRVDPFDPPWYSVDHAGWQGL